MNAVEQDYQTKTISDVLEIITEPAEGKQPSVWTVPNGFCGSEQDYIKLIGDRYRDRKEIVNIVRYVDDIVRLRKPVEYTGRYAKVAERIVNQIQWSII